MADNVNKKTNTNLDFISAKKKRRSLTKKQQGKLKQDIELGISKANIIEKYMISERTYFRIKKSDEIGIDATSDNGLTTRKIYQTKYIDINISTVSWINECEKYGVPVNIGMIKSAALNFAKKRKQIQFKASNGWFGRLCDRFGLRSRVIQGEELSADIDAAKLFQANYHDITKDYEVRNIFNVDETGLFFKMLPDKTFSSSTFKSTGLKNAKERLTILFGVSMTGEQLEPLIIGKSANPRNLSKEKIKSLKLQYTSNSKAWITKEIFSLYLKDLNTKFQDENRNILLFLDNFSGHKVNDLSNIKLHFLPPNTTSLIQPLDQGVINTFKINYRKIYLNTVISNGPENIKAAIKDYKIVNAIENISTAWNKIEKDTIIHCFARICKSDHIENRNVINVDSKQVQKVKDLANKMHKFHILNEAMNIEDYIEIDNNKSYKELAANILLNEKLEEEHLVTKVQCKGIQKIKETMEILKEQIYESSPELITTFLDFNFACIELWNKNSE